MKIRKLLLLLILFFCAGFKGIASTQPPQPQPQSIPPPVGDQVPIDEEIYVLMISGVLLGVYFILKKNIPKTTT